MKIIIGLIVIGIILFDFISYLSTSNKNDNIHIEDPSLESSVKRFYESKGWYNIGYDEDHNLIGNHPVYGNGELIQDYK